MRINRVRRGTDIEANRFVSDDVKHRQSRSFRCPSLWFRPKQARQRSTGPDIPFQSALAWIIKPSRAGFRKGAAPDPFPARSRLEWILYWHWIVRNRSSRRCRIVGLCWSVISPRPPQPRRGQKLGGPGRFRRRQSTRGSPRRVPIASPPAQES